MVTGHAVRAGRIEEKDPAGGKLSEVATVIVVGILRQQPVQDFREARHVGARVCLQKQHIAFALLRNDRGEEEESGRDALNIEAPRHGLLHETTIELLTEVVRDIALPAKETQTGCLAEKPGDLQEIADGIPVQPAARRDNDPVSLSARELVGKVDGAIVGVRYTDRGKSALVMTTMNSASPAFRERWRRNASIRRATASEASAGLPRLPPARRRRLVP